MHGEDFPRDPVVAVFPPASATAKNPYVARLHRALQERGVSLIDGAGFTPRWAQQARGKVDVVHLHWLEYIVRAHGSPRERFARTHVRAARFMLALRLLRAGGIRIVWTVHNRRPHETWYRWLDGPLSHYTALQADGLIFHSQAAALTLARDLERPLRAWIAPLPHYRGSYPADGRPRAVLRESYGLDNASFVYLMFGQIRGYKRVPQAIRAFRDLEDRDARLVIAGEPRDERETAEVRAAAAGDDRVLTLLRFVPDDEVSTLFELADAAILNYREVFSSAALLLALTYGVPVVAPEEGSAREVAPGEATETFAEGQLVRALRAIRTGAPAARRAAVLRAIEPYTYDALAEQVLRAYRDEGGTEVFPSSDSEEAGAGDATSWQ